MLTPAINVVLVDPSRLFREGLHRLLEGTAFHILAECGRLQDARATVRSLADISLVLIDIGIPSEEGFGLLQEIRIHAPGAKVVMLASSLDALSWPTVFSDIDGLLPKDISSAALLCSLQLVMLDEKIFPVALGFLSSAGELSLAPEPAWPDDRSGPEDRPKPEDRPEPEDRAGLSLRELQILYHLRRGAPNKVIARELNVAETTVKAHIKAILRKIKADNRTQAAIWCLTNGLPDVPVLIDRARPDTMPVGIAE